MRLKKNHLGIGFCFGANNYLVVNILNNEKGSKPTHLPLPGYRLVHGYVYKSPCAVSCSVAECLPE